MKQGRLALRGTCTLAMGEHRFFPSGSSVSLGIFNLANCTGYLTRVSQDGKFMGHFGGHVGCINTEESENNAKNEIEDNMLSGATFEIVAIQHAPNPYYNGADSRENTRELLRILQHDKKIKIPNFFGIWKLMAVGLKESLGVAQMRIIIKEDGTCTVQQREKGYVTCTLF